MARLLFFKVSIELVTILLGQEALRTLASGPGIKPTPPALEGGVLTTGLLAVLPWGSPLHYSFLR